MPIFYNVCFDVIPSSCLVVLGSLLLLTGCREKPGHVEFHAPEREQDWLVYEGRVPLDEAKTLYLEVSMKETGMLPGEGQYRLEETLEDGEERRVISHIRGLYSASGGGGDVVVHLHHSSLDSALLRTWFSEDRRRIYEKPFRTSDVLLKRSGPGKLVLLDGGGPVTLEGQYNLVERTSQLFTVEGYFRPGEVASLYEINTKQTWHVSRYGDYYRAARAYHFLSDKNSDSVYLKAVGFSIGCADVYGCEDQALFLKTVIQVGM